MLVETLIVFGLRLMLVALFLFSAFYVLVDFKGMKAHVKSIGVQDGIASAMVGGALLLKLLASLALITGMADRLGAVALAGFCVITALFYKRFWSVGDFAFRADSKAMPVFWDFLKNVSLAAAFVLIALGGDVESLSEGLSAFVENPLSSTHPYEWRER
ncbi:DoxX family membrane protein [uncultured Roseobacter sp.]|uniref:DoxX family membrane protein n=1 Tax=uncultured Roseobacter sp. TaxID=114847 RepID=UPI00260366D9|nr:DoxX family membrane protein [uncultured Roseobacter sp.]